MAQEVECRSVVAKVGICMGKYCIILNPKLLPILCACEWIMCGGLAAVQMCVSVGECRLVKMI